MDIERIVVRMTADATQYLQMFDMVEARLVAFSGFMVQELLKSSLQLSMNFERMGLAFEVMTGSAEKGRKVLNDIVDLAMRTPFTTQELIKSGKQAMAFGIEDQDIIPVLERLGAISIATGSDMDRLILAFGQVRTVGRLMGQELRQFTNAGVPMLQYLARAMKVAEAEVPQLVRMGRVGFNDVAQAINIMTSEGGKFFGMLDRTNLETLFGRWQNFTEGVQKASRRLGDSIRDAFDLKAVVGGWAQALNTFDFDRLTGQLETVRDILYSVWNVSKHIIVSIGEWADANPELAAVIKTVFALGAAAYGLSVALGFVEFAFGALVLFFTPLATGIGLLWTGLTTLVGVLLPFAPVILAVVAAVAVLAVVLNDARGRALNWQNVLAAIGPILRDVGAALGELVSGIAGFAADTFIGTMEQLGRSLMRLYDVMGGLKDVFGEGIKGILAAFSSGDMELGFKIFLATAKFGFKALWEWMKLEWELAWAEMFITVEIGLKKALLNSVYFFARQFRRLLDGMGLQGTGRSQAELDAEQAGRIAGLDADRTRRLSDAANVARQRIDQLIDAMQRTPEAQQIRDDALVAQFANGMGEVLFNFRKQAESFALNWWGEGANGQKMFGPTAPNSALAGVVGPGVVQQEYTRLYMDAARAVFELDAQFKAFQDGAISRQQWDAAKAGAERARQAFQQFHDTLTGAAGAARRAAEAISMVFETSAATRAYMLDLSKEFDRGTTALGKFVRGMSLLEEAAAGPWKTLDRRNAAMAAIGAGGILGNRQMNPITEEGSDIETFGLFKQYQDLRRAIGSQAERRAPAALEGSREAAEIIGRNSTQTLSVQEQIHADLIMANELNRQQRDYMQEVANEMRRRRANGEFVPLNVNPGQ